MITSNTIIPVLVVSILFISNTNTGEKNTEKPSLMPYHKREAIKRRVEGNAADQIKKQYNVGHEEIKGIIPHTNATKDTIENLCGAKHPALLLANAVELAAIGYSIKGSGENSLTIKCHILLPRDVLPNESACPYKSAYPDKFDYSRCYNYCQNSYNPSGGY